MKASTNISLLAIASWLMLLAPPTAGAAKLRRRQAERNLQQQELLDIPPNGIDYAYLLEDSTVDVDKKSNKGSKYTPNSEDTSVLDFSAWDELVYAYAAENYNGDINLLDKYGWNDLVDLWSDQPNASKQPPRSKEETIATQEYMYYLPPAKETLPEAEKTLSPHPNVTNTGDSHTTTFAIDIRRMNADNGEVVNRVHNGMYYQYAHYDFTAAEGTMPFVIDSVSDHSSSATDGALHIKPRPNSLPYGQFGVGIGTHDPQYDLHVAGITEIDGDLIVKGRIFYYNNKPAKLDNKKKGETYENKVLPHRNRFDDNDDDDDEEEVIAMNLSGKEVSTLEKQLLDLQDKYQALESTVQQLMQRIDILEGSD